MRRCSRSCASRGARPAARLPEPRGRRHRRRDRGFTPRRSRSARRARTARRCGTSPRARRARRAGRRHRCAPPVAADWAYLAEQVRAERHDVDLARAAPRTSSSTACSSTACSMPRTLLYGLRFERARRPRRATTPTRACTRSSRTTASRRPVPARPVHARLEAGRRVDELPRRAVRAAGDLPVVVNNLNVPKPAAGEPTLLTLDETETLFHEFGHALHGLLARVRYPSLAGTNVYRDFVELPSQVNELWMLRPEVLDSYAVHHETGERMPQELVDRLDRRPRLQRGFETAEYLAAAVLDQAWHRLDRRRRGHGRRGLRARGARGRRPRRPARAAAVLEHVLRARVRGRLRRRLLLVHLERGAGRRHHGVVRARRRRDPRERRPLPREILAGRLTRPRRLDPGAAGARARRSSRCCGAAASPGGAPALTGAGASSRGPGIGGSSRR